MTRTIVGQTRERIFTQDVPVPLSTSEHTEKSEQLAKLDIEINGRKEAIRELTKAAREAIKEATAQRDLLATIVDTHKETRALECLEVCDFERNTVVVQIRATGEFVSERAMEGEERARLAQQEMGLNGEAQAEA